MRDGFGHDSNFTLESFVQRYNSDLANDFGNLFSRVTTLIKRNYDIIIPAPQSLSILDLQIENKGKNYLKTIAMIDGMRLNEAIENIMVL